MIKKPDWLRPAYIVSALGIALCAISASVSVSSIAKNFEGGLTYEFCHYAEIGRNILEGKGYRTRMVHPFTMAYLDQHGIPFDETHWAPVLDRFPLQSYLTAAAEALAGKDDAAILALSLLLMMACVVATFLIGCRYLSITEGSIAALLFAFDPSFQRGFLLWGLPDFAFCLLVTIAVAMMSSEVTYSGFWFFTGILTGLAWLARSNLMLWAPLFLWALSKRHSEKSIGPFGSTPALFTAGLLAASAPLSLYSLRWFHSITPPTMTWDLAHHVVTDEFPALYYRTYTVPEILFHHAPGLVRKFRVCLMFYLGDMPTLWQMQFMLPFGILGFFDLITAAYPPESRQRRARRFIQLMIIMFLLQLVVFSAIRYEALGAYVRGRYFLWLAPALFLLCAHGAEALGRRLGWPRLTCALFAIAILAIPHWGFLSYLSEDKPRWQHPGQIMVNEWPELKTIAKETSDDGLVATNLPAQVAWYAKRRALALPADPNDLIKIDQRHPIETMLISRLNLGEIVQTPIWRDMVDHPEKLKAWAQDHGFRISRDFTTSIILSRQPAVTPRLPK